MKHLDKIISEYEKEVGRILTKDQIKNLEIIVRITRKIDRDKGVYSQSHRLYKPEE